MDSKKPNKIRDIVRLQQLGKKWRKLANAPKNSGKKSISFLKRTLSFSDASRMGDVPKGYLAVCAGKEMKRFVIPTDYLSHYAFVELLKEAEEEFGFQNEGVLRIPCDADVFERILKMVEEEDGDGFFVKDDDDDVDDDCEEVGVSCGRSGVGPMAGLPRSHSHRKPTVQVIDADDDNDGGDQHGHSISVHGKYPSQSQQSNDASGRRGGMS